MAQKDLEVQRDEGASVVCLFGVSLRFRVNSMKKTGLHGSQLVVRDFVSMGGRTLADPRTAGPIIDTSRTPITHAQILDRGSTFETSERLQFGSVQGHTRLSREPRLQQPHISMTVATRGQEAHLERRYHWRWCYRRRSKPFFVQRSREADPSRDTRTPNRIRPNAELPFGLSAS